MKLLLDTHIFIWDKQAVGKLSTQTRSLIFAPTTERFVSTAVFWEMQIKERKGGIGIGMPPQQFVSIQRQLFPFKTITIQEKHVWTLQQLPLIHKDPFDRIMIAQAIAESLTLVSVDGKFNAYPVPLLM